MKNTAVFLDRDGVLNEAIIRGGKPYPPTNPSELIIPAEVKPALQLLKQSGFILIVATNQPDVARGKTERAWVEKIHTHLMQTLPLDGIEVCYHDDQDSCDCRKPLPGLLLQAALRYPIDLQRSFMIGDRWKDIVAGQRAGCKTVWLDRKYQETKPTTPDFITFSLIEAALWINKQAQNQEKNHVKYNQS